MHRRGVALLLVVLPDGSRSLIPAGWTDLAAMRLVVRRSDELDGNHYEVLTPAADALAGKHPLAAMLRRPVQSRLGDEE